MALFNYVAKEVTLKIVYYGTGLSGKTTNLQHLHSALDPEKAGRLISLATETDRTLFFDFLPVELGKINDFSVRFQLYTVPGQIKYNLTRKAVLKGANAVVFVADSQREVRETNMESFANMKENLLSNNIYPDNIILVLQYNKRDLPNILPVDELNKSLNSIGYLYHQAEAINGKGVKETFQTVTKLLIKDLSEKYKFEILPLPYEETIKAEEIALPSLSQELSETITLEEPAQPCLSQQETASTKKNIEEPILPKTEEPPEYLSEQIDKLAESLRENTHMLASVKSAANELLDELKNQEKNRKRFWLYSEE